MFVIRCATFHWPHNYFRMPDIVECKKAEMCTFGGFEWNSPYIGVPLKAIYSVKWSEGAL